MKKNRVAVIGGGASGLYTCAVLLKRGFCGQITLFEKCDRVGRKILLTGNGRCNLTNRANADMRQFCAHYTAPEAVSPLFGRYDVTKTLDFFAELGLVTHTQQDGGVYPVTDSASSVLDVLRLCLFDKRIEVLCNTEIVFCEKQGSVFTLRDQAGKEYVFDRLVYCVGGRAGISAKEDMYSLARQLGHTIIAPTPCLVPIKCTCEVLRGLNGVRTPCAVSLRRGNQTICTQRGELLIKDYGISGICVFQLTTQDIDDSCTVQIDLFDGVDAERILLDRKQEYPDMGVEYLFVGLLHRRIGENVLKHCHYSLDSKLRDIDIAKVVRACKTVTAHNLQVLPFDKAQTTKGGVAVKEIDFSLMRSRLIEGLYILGEAVDVTGECGGYNLQFAWSSAYACAEHLLSQK